MKENCALNYEFVQLIEVIVLSIELLDIKKSSTVFNTLSNKLQEF